MKEYSFRWWICFWIYGAIYHPIKTSRCAFQCAKMIAVDGAWGGIRNSLRIRAAIKNARPIVEARLRQDAEREAERLDRLHNPGKWLGAE